MAKGHDEIEFISFQEGVERIDAVRGHEKSKKGPKRAHHY
jgi:hypothetical protein